VTLIDYARPIAASTLVASGVTGVLRYWPKQGGSQIVIGLAGPEIADLDAHSISHATIYEDSSASWMSGGWAAGVAAGTWLRQQFAAAGYTPRTVYMAADDNTLSTAAINACLDGAASVLGRSIVGLYGYLYQLQSAQQGNHAARYWLTGHWVDPATYPWIGLYQHNGSQPTGSTQIAIAGQDCDINTPFAPDWGQEGASEVELNTVYTDWAGNQQTVQGTFDHLSQDTVKLSAKVPSKVNPAYTLLPLEFLPWIDKNIVDLAQAVAQLSAKVGVLGGQIAAEEADLLAAIKNVQAGSVDPAAVAAALEPALQAGLPAPIVQALLVALSAKLGGGA
jgi:hypothetical protein